MSTNLTLSSSVLSMTSREIAELTGKRHDNVLRDIDALIETLPSELRNGIKASTYVSGSPPREYRQFVLDRDSTYCLITGYDAVSRMRIIKRWQELEGKQAPALPPMTPSQIGKQCILDMLDVAELFGAPKSYAIQVAASEAVRQTGMPWDRLLTQAAAMTNVPHEDVMLEPTELGKLFDLSAIAMNRQLATLGLQVKEGGEWRPTEEGAGLCQRHAWVSGSKSGYNLKWRAKDIEALMLSASE